MCPSRDPAGLPLSVVGDLLPGRDVARIPPEKLRDYVLSTASEVGRHKARVFRSTLALSQDDWQYLREALLAGLQDARISDVRLSRFGPRSTVPVAVLGRNGELAVVTTAWEIDRSGHPRLLTAYIRAR
jgi:hypothetical protein